MCFVLQELSLLVPGITLKHKDITGFLAMRLD